MTPAHQLIAEVRAIGGVLSISGERLRVLSDDPVPDDLLSRLRAAKADVMDAIRQPRSWRVQDWRDYYDERAAIVEHDAAKPRMEAQAVAFEHCIVKWLALNPPVDRGPDACCFCGNHAGAHALVVLAGDGSLHRIVHARCHTPMRAKRRAEAATAIRAALAPRGVNRDVEHSKVDD
jgi:hypothetical protein